MELNHKLLKPTGLISRPGFVLLRLLPLLLATGATHLAFAQNAVPDAGKLLQELEQNRNLPSQSNPAPVVERKAQAPTNANTGIQIQVARYEFTGASFLDEPRLAEIAEPFTNRLVSFSEISGMLEEISALYRESGRLARVFLPEQDIQDGVVHVSIVESLFGKIRLEEAGKAMAASDERRITGFMQNGQDEASLLDLRALERSAILANEVPGYSSRIMLAAGEQTGFTDVIVVADQTAPLSSTTLVDNFGSRSTGTMRFTAVGQAANLMGRGESLQFNALVSEGNRYGAVNFQYPIGHHGLTAGVSSSLLEYDLIGDFAALEASGEAFSIDANVSYPLIRSSRSRLDIKARFGQRDYTNTQAQTVVSDKVIDAAKIELRGLRADDWMGSGETFYRLNATFGQVDLSGNAANQQLDRIGPETEGSYQVVTASIGRRQRLSSESALKISFEAQQANKNLDSSETFVLGGPNRVRAYPVLEGVGDDGWSASSELVRRLNETLTASAFYDYGQITRKSTLAAPKSTQALQGAGLSLSYRGQNQLFSSITLSRRFGENPFRRPATGYDSDGSLRLWRLWLQVGKSF